MTTMKAVVVHKYGGPDVLHYEDAPKPSLNEGDVLIRVEAAGVNPGEAKIRQGDFAAYHTLPFILGYDIAGTIAEVARGVIDAQVGDAVYTNCDSTRNGGYAEFVAVRASEVAPRPRSLDAVQAASVPLSGLTAWQALADAAHLAPGQKVLVHGAGGAVGSFAVQFAKVMGGVVVATASGDDLDYVRQIGADTVVDYKTQRFEDFAKDMDVVLDTIGGETGQRSFSVVKPGGLIITFAAPPDTKTAEALGLRTHRMEVEPNAAQLGQIADLIDSGKVQTRVGLVLPLSEARQAHERLAQGGTRGKIVLAVT
jgi:NADPH:quinone reductase-like Zn-dependent oxidoreductase